MDTINQSKEQMRVPKDETEADQPEVKTVRRLSGDEPTLFEKLRKAYPHAEVTTLSILSWYVFSLGISLYNKWMFSAKKLNFSFPIIITSFHQALIFGLSILAQWMIPSFRLNSASHYIKAGHQQQPKLSYVPSVSEYFGKILPCSLASAGDIGFGNTAFRFITLSLYTMVKTSALIFVLLWGVLFKLERMSMRILSIVLVMIFGVSMMMWDPQDDSGTSTKIKRMLIAMRDNATGRNLAALGVSLVLLSSCMSGLRWALTQIMLKRSRRTRNPILTMMYLSPAMAVVLIVIGCLVEGFGNFLHAPIWQEKGIPLTCLLVAIPGLLAFFMTLSEYILLQHATLLTLSFAGIFKELLTIFASAIVFGDRLSLVNIFGLVITFTDIICYNIYRFQENTSKLPEPATRATSHEFVDIEMNNVIIDDEDDDEDDLPQLGDNLRV